MERAPCPANRLAGEELPIVLAGKLLGTYRKHNFGHIRFVLSQRSAERWCSEGSHFASLRPGHPVYDRMRREWQAEEAAKARQRGEDIVQSINAKMQRMQERAIADGWVPGHWTAGRGDGSPRADREASEQN